MRLYKILILTIFIIPFLGVLSCNKDEMVFDDATVGGNPFQEENNKIEDSISLNEDEAILELGDTLELTPKFGDGQNPLKYYSWKVDNENVIKIVSVDDKDYKVSVIGLQAGVTTVTLFSDDRLIKASCTITVDDPFDDGIVRILMIGNDSPEDSIERYLYNVAKAAGKKVIIGNLYLEDASLADHWDNASANNKSYDFRVIDENGNKTSSPNTSIAEALASDGWSYISFQQASSTSGMFNTYTTPFPALYDYVQARAKNFKAEFLLHQGWAYQQGASIQGFSNYGNDQMTMYHAIVNAVSDASGLKPIDFIVPGGTAIQNGRATILGDNFTIDGEHLNSLGQYTVACTWFESIFGEDVIGNSFSPDELDPREIEIAQHVAHAAVITPGTVTVLDAYKPVRGILNAPVLIGFGSENLPNYPKWNAFVGDAHAGSGNKITNLIDTDRKKTGIPLEIVKGFNGRNNSGKSDVTLFGVNIPNDIATHSYYGNSKGSWAGRVVEESKLKLSKLDKNLSYDICFYASRNGVSDNRETKYICEGSNSVTVTLDAANNGTNIVCAEGVQPDINGEIIITVTSGEHNTNGFGFFYLNIMKISRSN